MTTLELDLFFALKEIEDVRLAEEAYRWDNIGSYPDVKISEDVRTKWLADLDIISKRGLEARKKSQQLILKVQSDTLNRRS